MIAECLHQSLCVAGHQSLCVAGHQSLCVAGQAYKDFMYHAVFSSNGK